MHSILQCLSPVSRLVCSILQWISPIRSPHGPWAKLGENSRKPGTAESAIVSAGLNAPIYWNDTRWSFDAINSVEAIQIGRNCLPFPMVNRRLPAECRMFTFVDSQICAPKQKTLITSSIPYTHFFDIGFLAGCYYYLVVWLLISISNSERNTMFFCCQLTR